MTETKTLVVGLGNPILSDDSVGIRVARVLQGQIDQPGVTVTETSIAGLDFLELLPGYDRVIIIDAIQTDGGQAGQIYRLGQGTLAPTRHSCTAHDISFATSLELGRKLGLNLPPDITIFAVEVEDVVTLSEKCTPDVEKAIPRCVELVASELDLPGLNKDAGQPIQ